VEDQPSTTDETPGSSPDSSSPKPLVRQPHGGALLRGGNWGNRGGKGRPPSVIKEAMRAEFDELIPRLRKLTRPRWIEEKDPKTGQTVKRKIPADPMLVLQVANIFGRYGMDAAVSIADVRAALDETRREIEELLPPDLASVLLERIAEHWVKL
jgi:hypothetical protein